MCCPTNESKRGSEADASRATKPAKRGGGADGGVGYPIEVKGGGSKGKKSKGGSSRKKGY